MNIIAIDCGASFIKACKIDEETRQIKKARIWETPRADGQNTMLEKSAEVIKRAINELAAGQKRVKIGFSTEMHGFVVADKIGQPYLDYVSWQDECAYESYAKATYLSYVKSVLNDEDIRKTGMPIKAGLPSVNLFYYLQNHLKDVPNESIFFYTLGDYYIRRMSGKEPLIHNTNAAATGLFDIQKNNWNERIIKELGMEGIHFPCVSCVHEPISARLGEMDILFYPAIGDQQAALLGAGLQEEGTLSINFGTGAQVSVYSVQPVFSEHFQTRPYFNGRYINTVPHIPSGRALNVYFRFVKDIVLHFASVSDEKIWELIMKEVDADDASKLEVDMSFFTNAVTDQICGSIKNITEKNFTLGNLFHSAYYQMAVNMKKALDKMGERQISRVIFSGGVVRKNAELRKLMLGQLQAVQDVKVAENETAKGISRFIDMCE